jgi:hypothetical protein
MHDPFAHLNLEQIQEAEKKYRALHPILWWVRSWLCLRGIRRDGFGAGGEGVLLGTAGRRDSRPYLIWT